MNEPLTPTDLTELERMLSESGIGNAEDVQKAKDMAQGLGLFVRSLIGLDREAAKKALASFLSGKTLRANQIEFLNLITDHLTEHGTMDARLLYDSPYTDYSQRGVDGVFESKEVDELVSLLEDVRKRAVG
jgi:type I restriction enzyme R subunit